MTRLKDHYRIIYKSIPTLPWLKKKLDITSYTPLNLVKVSEEQKAADTFDDLGKEGRMKMNETEVRVIHELLKRIIGDVEESQLNDIMVKHVSDSVVKAGGGELLTMLSDVFIRSLDEVDNMKRLNKYQETKKRIHDDLTLKLSDLVENALGVVDVMRLRNTTTKTLCENMVNDRDMSALDDAEKKILSAMMGRFLNDLTSNEFVTSESGVDVKKSSRSIAKILDKLVVSDVEVKKQSYMTDYRYAKLELYPAMTRPLRLVEEDRMHDMITAILDELEVGAANVKTISADLVKGLSDIVVSSWNTRAPRDLQFKRLSEALVRVMAEVMLTVLVDVLLRRLADQEIQSLVNIVVIRLSEVVLRLLTDLRVKCLILEVMHVFEVMIKDIKEAVMKLKNEFMSTDALIHEINDMEMNEVEMDVIRKIAKHKANEWEIFHTERGDVTIEEDSCDDIVHKLFQIQSEHNHKKRVFIEGQFGHGKTTLCQHVAYNWGSSGENLIDCLILIKLNKVKTSVYGSIAELIGHPAMSTSEVKSVLLSYDRVLLILDGYDELVDNQQNKDEVIEILEGEQVLPNVLVLVTSRPVIKDLISSSQPINTYCLKGFKSDVLGKIAIDHLNDFGNTVDIFKKQVDIFSNSGYISPLITICLIIIYSENQNIVINSMTGVFYELLLVILKTVQKKSSSKSSTFQADELLQTYNYELDVLCSVAYNLIFSSGKTDLSLSYLELSAIIQKIENPDKKDIDDVLLLGLLDRRFEEKGLETKEVFCFYHRAFAEFLVAFKLIFFQTFEPIPFNCDVSQIKSGKIDTATKFLGQYGSLIPKFMGGLSEVKGKSDIFTLLITKSIEVTHNSIPALSWYNSHLLADIVNEAGYPEYLINMMAQIIPHVISLKETHTNASENKMILIRKILSSVHCQTRKLILEIDDDLPRTRNRYQTKQKTVQISSIFIPHTKMCSNLPNFIKECGHLKHIYIESITFVEPPFSCNSIFQQLAELENDLDVTVFVDAEQAPSLLPEITSSLDVDRIGFTWQNHSKQPVALSRITKEMSVNQVISNLVTNTTYLKLAVIRKHQISDIFASLQQLPHLRTFCIGWMDRDILIDERIISILSYSLLSLPCLTTLYLGHEMNGITVPVLECVLQRTRSLHTLILPNFGNAEDLDLESRIIAAVKRNCTISHVIILTNKIQPNQFVEEMFKCHRSEKLSVGLLSDADLNMIHTLDDNMCTDNLTNHGSTSSIQWPGYLISLAQEHYKEVQVGKYIMAKGLKVKTKELQSTTKCLVS